MAVLLAGPIVACADAPPGRLIVTIKGDNVQYGFVDPPWGEIQGNAHIFLEVEGQPDKRAIIHADRAAFKSGQIEAQNGVTLGLPDGLLTGEYLRLDPKTGEFCLQQVRGVVNFNAGASAVHGYAFGEEVVRDNEIIYVVQGKITTCNREHPHYALQAKRIEYYPDQQRFKIKGGSLSLYGVKIPLIPSFSFDVAEEERETPDILPVPGYSSHDNLYLPYLFKFSLPDSPWRSELRLRVTQKRGIRLLSTNEYAKGRWQAGGYLSQTEDVYNDLGNYMTLDRRPELTFTRFATSPDQDDGWRASVNLANIVEDMKGDEHTADPRPTIREQRAAVTLAYDRHNQQRHSRQGQWYGLSARQALYSTGDSYRDLALTLGAGGKVSGALTGSLSLTRHITSGHTPFLSDVVDIKTELQPALAAQLSPRWAMSATGKYDVDEGKLRDYELELQRRAHCLTWGLYYRFTGERIGVRVDINGLTGNTTPYPQQSDLDKLYQNTQQELAAGAGQE